MPKIGDLKPGPLKILLCGKNGAGKTALALTCGSVAQIIDIDLGSETALGMTRVSKPDQFAQARKEVDHIPCPEPNPISNAVAFQRAKDTIIAIANAIQAGKYPFKVLIVDSFTMLAAAATRYVLYNSGRLVRPVDVKVGSITQPEWGLMINEVSQTMQLLAGLPIHVIVTAHLIPNTDTNGNMLGWEIAIPTRKLPPEIPNYFDEIWLAEVQDAAGGVKRRQLITESSPWFPARSRAGLPNNTDMNLGMPAIFKLLGREI